MANLRTRVDSGFEKFGRTVFHNRYKTLLLMALLIAALLSQLPRIKLDTSTEAFFHKDDPALVTYDAFREQFGRDELVIVAIRPPEVFDRGFLTKLGKMHAALEDEVPYLDDVTSLINVRNTRGERDELIVEDLLKKLPETPEGMAELKARVLSSALYPNFLISEDGRFTTIVVETLAYSPEGGEGDLLAGFKEGDDTAEEGGARRKPLSNQENREIVNAVNAVAARFEAEDFPIHIVGTPVWGNFLLTHLPRDMSRFMGLAILAIAFFLFLLFRRVSGVVLPLLVVILSLLSTISLMAITGTPLTIPTTILPSFLLAVGVGASVHILVIFFRNFQQTGDKEGALVHTLGHSGFPIVMTGLTTAAGLFAFATADLAPVAHLGQFGGLGVLLGLLYTLILVPALLAVWPVRQQARLASRAGSGLADRMLEGIARFSTTHAWSVVIVSALVVAVAAAGLPSLRLSHQPTRWIPESTQLRQSLDLVDRELKGSNSLEVIVDTGRENGLYDPVVLKKMDALAAFAMDYRKANGEAFAGKTQSVTDVLKETHRALNENRSAFYAIPDNRQLVAQELLLFENSGSDDLEKMVDTRFTTARLTVKVRDNDAGTYVGFVKEIEDEAKRLFGDSAEITVTGLLRLFTGVVTNMISSMIKSYTIAIVVITGMMILLLGSFRIGLLSMIPNLAPILVTLGLMGWTGIALDGFTLLIGSIALGLAVDDTIHFFHNFRRYFVETGNTAEAVRETLLSTGRAMIFTTLVLVTGFWLFMFATLNNVFFFGLLTGITLIVALLADLLLAPAMMELIIRTGRGRRIAMRWGAGGD